MALTSDTAAPRRGRTRGRSLLASVLRWIWAHPTLFVVLLVALQTLPTLWSKDIWIVDESRHAAVLVQMLENGHWLVLQLGEHVYPDKPPLHFWIAALIALIAGSTAPWVMSLATAIGAAVFSAATVQMSLAFGLGRRMALIAGVITVTCQHFLISAHMPRMDLLFGALIGFTHLAFFIATQRPEGQRARPWALGFLLMALAVLAKGPLAVLVCLAVLLVYMAMLGRIRELWRREVALGSLGLILPMAAYLAGIILIGGPDFLRLLLLDQSVGRAFAFPQNNQPVWFYLHKIPEALVPWSLVLFLAHWRKLTPGLVKGWATADPGKLYVFLCFTVALLILSSFSYKIAFLVFVVLGPASILVAMAVDALTPARRSLYFTAIALGAPVGFVVMPFTVLPLPMASILQLPVGWAIYAGFLLPALALFLLRRRSVRLGMTFAALTMTLASLPFYIWGFGMLDRVMSTRDIARQINGWQAQGYEIFHHHPYELGWFDYHAGQVIPGAFSLDELAPRIKATRCAALITAPRDWRAWQDAPEAAKMVYRTTLYTRPLAIVLFDNRANPVPGTACTEE